MDRRLAGHTSAPGIEALTEAIMHRIQQKVVGLKPVQLGAMRAAVYQGIEGYVEAVNKPLSEYRQDEAQTKQRVERAVIASQV